jgi:hypothetical protein
MIQHNWSEWKILSWLSFLTQLPIAFLLMFILGSSAFGEGEIQIARVQYYGGDYYTDPTSLPNLAEFVSKETSTPVKALDGSLSLLDPNLPNYQMLYLTGHGEIQLGEDEVLALRKYLMNGGFLFVNDNGPAKTGNSIDAAFRREIERVLPGPSPSTPSPLIEGEIPEVRSQQTLLIELPREHPFFHFRYEFPDGIPQIHRHDEEQPPRAFGIFIADRLAVFYCWNSDLGNGWENQEVHGDPPEKRLAALQMGTNVLLYALMQ